MKKAIPLVVALGLVYALAIPGASAFAKNTVSKSVAVKMADRDAQIEAMSK